MTSNPSVAQMPNAEPRIGGVYGFIDDHIAFLNSSKLFAGIVMILINIGGKFLPITFSKSTEEYLKLYVTKPLLVFCISWLGTRCVWSAFLLTCLFLLCSDYLFNDESHFCIVPHKYQVLHKLMDTNGDGVVSELEINDAIAVLEKAKKEKQRQAQREQFTLQKKNKTQLFYYFLCVAATPQLMNFHFYYFEPHYRTRMNANNNINEYATVVENATSQDFETRAKRELMHAFSFVIRARMNNLLMDFCKDNQSTFHKLNSNSIIVEHEVEPKAIIKQFSSANMMDYYYIIAGFNRSNSSLLEFKISMQNQLPDYYYERLSYEELFAPESYYTAPFFIEKEDRWHFIEDGIGFIMDVLTAFGAHNVVPPAYYRPTRGILK